MNSQRVFRLMIFAGLVGLLAACGGNPAPAPAAQVQGLETSYANALDVRAQLVLGTVRLEEVGGPALSQEQATKLLPLWQTSKSLMASGTASQAEIDAVTTQILAAMTPEQLQAIKAMHLVQADQQAFNQSLGVTAPSGTVSGQGQNLSPQARATLQAQTGGTSGTGAIDYLIKILEGKAEK